jgi:hypothetical protein
LLDHFNPYKKLFFKSGKILMVANIAGTTKATGDSVVKWENVSFSVEIKSASLAVATEHTKVIDLNQLLREKQETSPDHDKQLAKTA